MKVVSFSKEKKKKCRGEKAGSKNKERRGLSEITSGEKVNEEKLRVKKSGKEVGRKEVEGCRWTTERLIDWVRLTDGE